VRIVVLDPGGTTGYIVTRLPWPEVFDRPENAWQGRYGQIGPTDHHHRLREFLDREAAEAFPYYKLTILYERFDKRDNDFAKLISAEYIGVVKEWCQANNVEPISQGSDVKKWASDDKLIRTGLLIKPKTKWKHANDAMRHFLYYGVHNNWAPRELRDRLLERLKNTRGL
jgi:hypothetical protein